jgi:hypothetical protein
VTLRSRRGLAIGGVGAVLLVAVMMARDTEPGDTTAALARRGAGPAAAAGVVPVADVKLELLQRTPPGIEEAQRNLFRFLARPAPPAPPRPRAQPTAPAPVAPPVTVPSGPPPPPPIPMRFIGLVDAPTQGGRVAILSDGRGNVFYGKEGDIIEGRYKVLKVSPDAAELTYLDGRGRQTIRLSGQ